MQNDRETTVKAHGFKSLAEYHATRERCTEAVGASVPTLKGFTVDVEPLAMACGTHHLWISGMPAAAPGSMAQWSLAMRQLIHGTKAWLVGRPLAPHALHMLREDEGEEVLIHPRLLRQLEDGVVTLPEGPRLPLYETRGRVAMSLLFLPVAPEGEPWMLKLCLGPEETMLSPAVGGMNEKPCTAQMAERCLQQMEPCAWKRAFLATAPAWTCATNMLTCLKAAAATFAPGVYGVLPEKRAEWLHSHKEELERAAGISLAFDDEGKRNSRVTFTSGRDKGGAGTASEVLQRILLLLFHRIAAGEAEKLGDLMAWNEEAETHVMRGVSLVEEQLFRSMLMADESFLNGRMDDECENAGLVCQTAAFAMFVRLMQGEEMAMGLMQLCADEDVHVFETRMTEEAPKEGWTPSALERTRSATAMDVATSPLFWLARVSEPPMGTTASAFNFLRATLSSMASPTESVAQLMARIPPDDCVDALVNMLAPLP